LHTPKAASGENRAFLLWIHILRPPASL
jgi:hypothetical protein